MESGTMDQSLELPAEPPTDQGIHRTNQLDYLNNVSVSMWCHPHACLFFESVDTDQQTDYLNIIKSPMDLRTIRKRFENHYYWEAKEVIDDVQLMFENFFLYNETNKEAVAKAKEYNDFWLSKLSCMSYPEIKILKEPQDPENVTLQNEVANTTCIQSLEAEKEIEITINGTDIQFIALNFLPQHMNEISMSIQNNDAENIGTINEPNNYKLPIAEYAQNVSKQIQIKEEPPFN